jgi:threonine dehydratase
MFGILSTIPERKYFCIVLFIFYAKGSDMKEKPSFSGVIDADRKLQGTVAPTPIIHCKIGESDIWLKCESAQPMGAFKLRGAWHRLTALSDEERRRGVVAFSSGNHAQGVAWAAARLGISATIVMPADAPSVKLEGTRVLGAEIILYDRATESREELASRIARERGAVLVPSFDDPWIIEGQGSAGIEAVRQMEGLGFAPPDLIITPCGGGGLAAGLALAVPDAQIVVVEPEGWDDMGVSLRLGHIVPVGPHPPATLCDALQTPRVSSLTFDILSASGVIGISVSEAETCAAIRHAHRHHGLTLEAGGAVALAAVLAGHVTPGLRTLVLLSGGNIDPKVLASILAA